MSELVNLMDLDRPGLADFFLQLGEKPFRATQVTQWIHQHGVRDIASMTNLSKPLRVRLAQCAKIQLPTIVYHTVASDGVHKWLLELHCGNRVETVFIPETGRGTLCISSQAGCALACPFCSTAQQGFNRNLTTAEIIGQVWLAVQALADQYSVTNVVFMGMGEPLLNFDHVVRAIDLMLDDFAYGLSKRRVTLSTSGIIPAIDRLGQKTDVSLALSLHAPTDALRDQLVPINKKYPIKPLLDACERYIGNGEKRRCLTIEYVMIDAVNDTLAHAQQLARLLKNYHVKINLIPFNPFPASPYRKSPVETIAGFANALKCAGYTVTTRKTRGEDIDAACGQLVGRVADKSRRRLRVVTINE